MIGQLFQNCPMLVGCRPTDNVRFPKNVDGGGGLVKLGPSSFFYYPQM